MPTRGAALAAASIWLFCAAGCNKSPANRGSGGESPTPEVVASPAPTAAERLEKPFHPTTAGHLQMANRLAELAAEVDEHNPYLGSGGVAAAEQQLADLPPNAGDRELLKAQVILGVRLLDQGREEEAIARLTEAVDLAKSLGDRLPRELYAQAEFYLAVAHFRFGETQNCCLRFTEDSCLLPIRGQGVHSDERGSRQAIVHLAEVLQNVAPFSERYLESVWLLNLAYMTLGEHPAQVPASYLIPAERFAASGRLPRFHNLAPALGVDELSGCGAAIVDDFDGDGLYDLMVSSWELRDSIHVYRNRGAEGLADVTAESGLAGFPGGLNMVQADYDNDGDVDVYVLRGAWCGENGLHPNSLLANRGDGAFVDVTYEAGLGEHAFPTQTAAWGDYDLDGDLDLYVGAEPAGDAEAISRLYRNKGDGTFVDVTATAGVANRRFAKGVLWGDVDADRYPDLIVSNYHAANRVYLNQRDGTFRDAAVELGIVGGEVSFPIAACDFDNNGALDLLVATYGGRVTEVAKYYAGAANVAGRSQLFLNDGTGRFRDQAVEFGLTEPTLAMGINFGDLDNDGWLDFYLGTGNPEYHQLIPNKMYRGVDGESFEDVSVAGGFSHLQKGHAIAFADFDRDGDADVFEQMGGAYPGDKFKDALYENPGFGAAWLGVRLVGTKSNRCAIGARIKAEFQDAGRARVVHRWVNSGGSFGGAPLEQLLGLGGAERVDRLEIYWPASDETQVFTNVAIGRHLEIVESAEDYQVLQRPAFRFSHAPRLQSPPPGG